MKYSVLLTLALWANTSLGQDDPNPPPGPTENRVIDGAMAANYLNTVKSLLEKPATLLV